MPQVVTKNEATSRSRWIALSAGLVLLCLIIGGVLYLKMAPPMPATTTKQALLNAQNLSFSDDNDGAITLLEGQLRQATNDDDKLMIHVAIGSNYEAKHEYKAALASFRRAQAIRATFATNFGVARSAEEAGDRATALDYYRRCEDMIVNGDAKQHYGDLPEVKEGIMRMGGSS